MARCWLILFSVIFWLQPLIADAQHFGAGFGSHSQPWVINPGWGHSGHHIPAFRHAFVYPNVFASYPAQPIQVASYPVYYPPIAIPTVTDPSKTPVSPSSAAARMRSVEYQMRGDQKIRQQKWAEARAAYKTSVEAAPDRAEGHLRLGLCLVAIQHYEPAIRQFKRALFIDPKLAKVAKFSQTLLGPDSEIVRGAIVSKVSDWVREDYRDSDRLFLLGLILHFEGDVRAQEVFEAAMRMKRKGDSTHITAFLDPNSKPVPGLMNDQAAGNPDLNELPIPLDIKPPVALKAMPDAPAPIGGGMELRRPIPVSSIPGAPIPMPDL